MRIEQLSRLGVGLSDQKRMLANLVHIGTVQSITEDGTRVVCMVGEIKTEPLPVLRANAHEDISYMPINVGEQVAILCPYGDFDQGLILGSIYTKNDIPDVKIPQVKFSDGTSISYDKKGTVNVSLGSGAKAININANDGVVNVDANNIGLTAKSKVTIKSSESVEINGSKSIDINSDANLNIVGTSGVEITGDTKVKGTLSCGALTAASFASAAGSGAGGAVIKGDISLTGNIITEGGDFIAKGISFSNHIHSVIEHSKTTPPSAGSDDEGAGGDA